MYAVIVCTKAANPDGAAALAAFLTSDAGQALIGDFGREKLRHQPVHALRGQGLRRRRAEMSAVLAEALRRIVALDPEVVDITAADVAAREQLDGAVVPVLRAAGGRDPLRGASAARAP